MVLGFLVKKNEFAFVCLNGSFLYAVRRHVGAHNNAIGVFISLCDDNSIGFQRIHRSSTKEREHRVTVELEKLQEIAAPAVKKLATNLKDFTNPKSYPNRPG